MADPDNAPSFASSSNAPWWPGKGGVPQWQHQQQQGQHQQQQEQEKQQQRQQQEQAQGWQQLLQLPPELARLKEQLVAEIRFEANRTPPSREEVWASMTAQAASAAAACTVLTADGQPALPAPAAGPQALPGAPPPQAQWFAGSRELPRPSQEQWNELLKMKLESMRLKRVMEEKRATLCSEVALLEHESCTAVHLIRQNRSLQEEIGALLDNYLDHLDCSAAPGPEQARVTGFEGIGGVVAKACDPAPPRAPPPKQPPLLGRIAGGDGAGAPAPATRGGPFPHPKHWMDGGSSSPMARSPTSAMADPMTRSGPTAPPTGPQGSTWSSRGPWPPGPLPSPARPAPAAASPALFAAASTEAASPLAAPAEAVAATQQWQWQWQQQQGADRAPTYPGEFGGGCGQQQWPQQPQWQSRPQQQQQQWQWPQQQQQQQFQQQFQQQAQLEFARQWQQSQLSRRTLAPEVTTLVVRNVPANVSQEDLLTIWPVDGSWDYFHCPFNLLHQRPLGYCFINFTSNALAAAFQRRWHGYALQGHAHRKALDVAAAELQGWRALLSRVKIRKLCLYERAGYLPVLFVDGRRLGIREIIEEADREAAIRRAAEQGETSATVGDAEEGYEREPELGAVHLYGDDQD